MKLTKRDVQKRVLKDGKPLDLNLFNWDIKTRTFKSEVYGLVIDFTGIDSVNFKTEYACIFKTGRNCVFNTGNHCTFDTESDCVFNTGYSCTFDTESDCVFNTGFACVFNTKSKCNFNTGSNCTFKTGDDCVFKTSNSCTFNTRDRCTFDTGSYCTFDTSDDCVFKTRVNCTFVTGKYCTFDTCNECRFITNYSCNFNVGHNCCIINKSNNEIIVPKPSIKLTTCPLYIPGYLIGSEYYDNGVKQEGAYMVADGILSKIISKKGDIYKVYDYIVHLNSFGTAPTYIVQDGDIFGHGETMEEARRALDYKISIRDTSTYENLTLDSVVTKEEAIKMYRVITGSCEYGVGNFVESLPEVKDTYTVQEIVDLTTGQYGNNVLRDFFKI